MQGICCATNWLTASTVISSASERLNSSKQSGVNKNNSVELQLLKIPARISLGRVERNR